VVLIKVIAPLYSPGARVLALSRTVNVTVRGNVVAVAVVNDAFSQLGIPEMKKPTLPVDEN
jgi:hypothetical protein